MKIALASDLHLEFKDITLKNEGNADVLVLSGDIMIAQDLHDHPHVQYDKHGNLGRRQESAQRFRDFLKRCSFEFPHVIYVAGNHEFYHGKWIESLNDLRQECSRFDNIYFMENDVKNIDGVIFVGATLWTDCNKGDPLTLHALQGLMNDYSMIRNDDLGYTKLRPAHTLSRHRRTMEYIKLIVDDHKDDTVVVVGHHAPTFMSIHDHYKHDHLMNGAFYSDLSEFIMDHPQIKLWTHGHTHTPFDYMVGDTRVVCNPRGYYGHETIANNFQLKYLEV